MPPPSIAADARVPRVHLLDVGPEEYADAALCQFGNRVILIDGAHPGDHTGREGRALFDAKIEYLRGMPHGRDSDEQQAIEFKILRQYTCLGLGW